MRARAGSGGRWGVGCHRSGLADDAVLDGALFRHGVGRDGLNDSDERADTLALGVVQRRADGGLRHVKEFSDLALRQLGLRDRLTGLGLESEEGAQALTVAHVKRDSGRAHKITRKGYESKNADVLRKFRLAGSKDNTLALYSTQRRRPGGSDRSGAFRSHQPYTAMSKSALSNVVSASQVAASPTEACIDLGLN